MLHNIGGEGFDCNFSFFLLPFLDQMFEWDNENVIITGSSDGIVRVSLSNNYQVDNCFNIAHVL